MHSSGCTVVQLTSHNITSQLWKHEERVTVNLLLTSYSTCLALNNRRVAAVQLVMRSCQWMLLKVEAGAWLDQKLFSEEFQPAKTMVTTHGWWPPCDQKGPAWLWKSKKDEWWWSGHLVSPFLYFFSSSSSFFLYLMSLGQLNPFFSGFRPLPTIYLDIPADWMIASCC